MARETKTDTGMNLVKETLWTRLGRLVGISRSVTQSPDIVQAESDIVDANVRVEESMEELEKLEPTHVVNLLDSMRDQTIAYANRNARVIAERFGQIRRAVVGLMVIVFLIGMLFGGLTYAFVHHNNQENSKLHRTEQISRFAGSYESCLNTNARSVAVRGTLAHLLDPKFESKLSKVQQVNQILRLGNEIAPLRDNEGNVFTEPLPNPIPLGWERACAEYAAKEVTINTIPSRQIPPGLPGHVNP